MALIKKFLAVYTDGGARGNPGPAASGFVVKDESGETIFREGKYLGCQTNNFAEYTALVRALEAAHGLGASEVQVFMDSELIVRQMTGQYKIKQPVLRGLAAEAKRLMEHFRKITFTHIRREFNTDADTQVNLALDEAARSAKSR